MNEQQKTKISLTKNTEDGRASSATVKAQGFLVK